jgi:molybdopterin-guanine dinucleotide biosynthesis adapter protein
MMRVVGFAGFSGSGKTQLIESLIPLFKARGLRVSVIKHAHASFDVDRPGKDTFRHRAAGAFEVLVASNRRLALMREYEREAEPNVHHLIAEMSDVADWIFVEGFKSTDILKIEVWRAATGARALYPDEDFTVAIATDTPDALPEPTQRPVLDLNNPQEVAQHLMDYADRFEYRHQLNA